jgi:hypothetical protein
MPMKATLAVWDPIGEDDVERLRNAPRYWKLKKAKTKDAGVARDQEALASRDPGRMAPAGGRF